MEKIIGIVGIFALIFFLPVLGVLGGAFAGWCVSLFFDETIKLTLTRFGVDTAGVELWQIGATLGFVGGFFKANLSTDKS